MKRIATAALAFIFLAFFSACSGDVQTSGAGGQAGAGGAGDGGMGAGGLGDGSCSPQNPCNSGFCVYPVGACEADAVGVCQNGFTCDGPPSGPVCRCDGVVLEGEYAICDAWVSSTQLAEPALCAIGTFSCGPLQCKRHIEFCVATSAGPNGMTDYSCEPANGFCSGIADCSCLDLEALGCSGALCCLADADMQETVHIALP